MKKTKQEQIEQNLCNYLERLVEKGKVSFQYNEDTNKIILLDNENMTFAEFDNE